ncbi:MULTISPECIES: FecR family protein [Odoribacteraceae]|uniref:FecR family protein n=1 Tax=Odoribacteraceae TaxID=1853231 RepID=UPI000E48691E|nr:MULTISPECIES: FecR family protein [Odoribacteraceae]MCQ4872992.1 FecR family protein [Butyricimonas paravirosa]RHR78461.1 FecR family protein [Odoribacter sp. AF15-53]
MENERENSIDGLIRRFLLKGEEVDMKALREELKGEDRDAVKRRLLRLRKMGLQPDRMKIWREVQDELARRSTRQRVLRYVRYAAVFLLPLLLACILLMRQERNVPALVVEAGRPDTTIVRKVFLLLEGGKRIELSTLAKDSIHGKDGKLLAIDTSGTLICNAEETANAEVSYQTVIVPRGGEYNLVLSDGTRVRLNADSELRFPSPFTGKERMVYLKGEGYFEVQRDSTAPFRVVANDAIVEVLGTKFNISAYPGNDKSFTTLVSGSVKVGAYLGDESVVLKPDEQAILSHGEVQVKKVNAEDYVSWVNGRFYFEKMPLEEILVQLERWYDLQVFWASEELKVYEFTGAVWRDNTIRQTLDMIEKTTDVRFTVSGRTVMVNASL